VHALVLEAFQGLIGGLVWLGLLHSVWLGLATAATVALALQSRRDLSHRSRHTTLLTALTLVALGPPALATAQHLVASRPSARSPERRAAGVVVLNEDPGTRRSIAPSAAAGPRQDEAPAAARFVGPFLTARLSRVAEIARAVRPVVLATWALTVSGLGVVLALGVRGVYRLRRDANPAPGFVDERVRELGRRLRLRNVPAVRVHARLGEPCLCGVLRPVILLPERWLATARAESLDAVLAHELAHARRRDHLVNLAQRLVETLLFFHPGVHWLSRSLRRQRELCADALAVRLTGDPLALARALESVARLRAGTPAPLPVGAALGGERVSLLPRIQELIGMTPIRPRPQVWPFAALPMAAALALVAVSVGLAQDGPPTTQNTPRLSQLLDYLEQLFEAPQSPTLKRVVPEVMVQGQGVLPSPWSDQWHRQICYEVRFIDLGAQPWRDVLEGRLKPVEREDGSHGWVIDTPALTDLLKSIQGDPVANVIQSPKVTTLENAYAMMYFGRVPPHTFVERRPGVGPDAEWAPWVKVTGSFSSQGTRLSVDLLDAPPTADQGKRPDDARGGDPHDQPAPGLVRYRGSCDVPDGSSIVVGLGRHERQVGSRSVAGERLVVITPLRIVLEAGELKAIRPTDEATSRPISR
jgi:hypothetical protein